MSQKIIAVQGAMCKCKFGNAPDSIKVLSHKKEYINDSQGSDKLVVTTKEIGGATLKKNTFGSCSLQRNRPCKPSITKWTNYYKDVVLSNGGYIIHQESKATCAVAGSPCIDIINHGQMGEPSLQNFDNANQDIQAQLNPMIDISEMNLPERTNNGLIFE